MFPDELRRTGCAELVDCVIVAPIVIEPLPVARPSSQSSRRYLPAPAPGIRPDLARFPPRPQ